MRIKVDVAAEVAALSGLSREELIARWQDAHGHRPPKGLRQELMIRSAAWHVQQKRLGGYSAETRRLLRSAIDATNKQIEGRIAKGTAQQSEGNAETDILDEAKGEVARQHGKQEADAATASKSSAMDLRQAGTKGRASLRQRRKALPGAKLLREWNGRTHVVDVIEGGFVFEAKVYASLSAIAQKITGAHWSGPRFFGL